MMSMNFYFTCKAQAEDPFVCPNCGYIFYVKWHKLYFTWGTIMTSNKARLKCPKCKQKDMCGRPHEAM